MNIDINISEHLVRVSLRGPCTIHHAARLRHTLRPLTEANTVIMIELDAITELDSAGMQTLLSLRQQHPSVLFCFANGVVRRTLEQLNLHAEFHRGP